MPRSSKPRPDPRRCLSKALKTRLRVVRDAAGFCGLKDLKGSFLPELRRNYSGRCSKILRKTRSMVNDQNKGRLFGNEVGGSKRATL